MLAELRQINPRTVSVQSLKLQKSVVEEIPTLSRYSTDAVGLRGTYIVGSFGARRRCVGILCAFFTCRCQPSETLLILLNRSVQSVVMSDAYAADRPCTTSFNRRSRLFFKLNKSFNTIHSPLDDYNHLIQYHQNSYFLKFKKFKLKSQCLRK